MEIEYPYAPLSEDEARGRLETLGKYLTNRHGIAVTWLDPSRAKFSGKYLVVKIEGELSMGNGKARFKGQDPGFLWRKRAEDYIREKLAYYLDPKNPLASLPTKKDG
jgi:hypothetical protein|nr:polyhydroxyalkanoic acid system family protein [Kofleriaceae bacterium]